MRHGLIGAITACAFAIAGLVPGIAGAQFLDADIPQSLLRPTRPAAGQTLTFCINTTSILEQFDRAVAREIAAALLVDYDIVEIQAGLAPVPPYDFRVPLQDSEIYLTLAHRCDALMGFGTLATYPDWMTLTPAYVTTRTVMAVRAGDAQATGPLGPGRVVGTRFLSMADNAALRHLRAQPADRQWARMMYPDNGFLIDRLMDGTVDTILVWEPALTAYRRDHPQAPAITILADLPFAVENSAFGIVMLRNNDFLHGQLSAAVTELDADGTLARLVEEEGF